MKQPSDDEVAKAVEDFLTSVQETFIGETFIMEPDWITVRTATHVEGGPPFLALTFKDPNGGPDDEGLNLALDFDAAVTLIDGLVEQGTRIWGEEEDESGGSSGSW